MKADYESQPGQGSADSLGDDKKDASHPAAVAECAQAQEPSLALLPPDCLALIFSLCKNNRDMKSFCSCCKALRCEAVRSQIDRISLDCNAITHAVQGLACFASFAPGLQQLRLSLETEDAGHPVFGGRGPMKGAWQILKLFQACKESSPTGAAARQSLSRIKQLRSEECDFRGKYLRGDLHHLAEHLKTLCPQLTKIQLVDADFDDAFLQEVIWPLRPKAIKLAPLEKYSISPLGVSHLTTLTELSWLNKDCYRYTTHLSKLQKLQRLELEGPVIDDLPGLDTVLQHCTQLKYMRLYGLPKYTLPRPPSLECFVIQELSTDDFPNLVDAVQRNLSPVYVIESLTVHPASGRSMKDLQAAASKLACYEAVKWDQCSTLVLHQAKDRRTPSAAERYLMDHEDENEDWDSRGSFNDNNDDRVKRHVAFMGMLNALEPLGHVLQGIVTSLAAINIRFMKEDMEVLAQFAGPSVHHLYFEECLLAQTTLAEAVRALPALTRVSIDNLGLAKNHRAVQEGMDVHTEKDKQQRQPLHLETKSQDVRFHRSDDDYECRTNMKMEMAPFCQES